jgi:hypothetical protein
MNPNDVSMMVAFAPIAILLLIMNWARKEEDE